MAGRKALAITERQKQALLAVYQSFRAESALTEPDQEEPVGEPGPAVSNVAPLPTPTEDARPEDPESPNPTEGN